MEIKEAIKYWTIFRQEAVELMELFKGRKKDEKFYAREIEVCDITITVLQEVADGLRPKLPKEAAEEKEGVGHD